MTITLNLEDLAKRELIHPSWVEPLSPVQAQLTVIEGRLNSLRESGVELFPAQENILRAFLIPFDEVKVVIVGQDPYPTPGDAVGLAFSVSPTQQSIPRSLKNIFTELEHDLGIAKPASGDLSPWCAQGVMLLNRTLTVESGTAGSHRSMGWGIITAQALRALSSRAGHTLVAVLWGTDAKGAKQHLDNAVLIESAHPSPLSASRGFFGSKPFSQVNTALAKLGQAPINWALPSYSALF